MDSLEDIISYEMVSYCFSQVIEFAAFVRLRQTCVDVERPYMALGGNGTWKAIALVTPAVLFTIAVMFFSSGAVWLSAAIQVWDVRGSVQRSTSYSLFHQRVGGSEPRACSRIVPTSAISAPTISKTILRCTELFHSAME